MMETVVVMFWTCTVVSRGLGGLYGMLGTPCYTVGPFQRGALAFTSYKVDCCGLASGVSLDYKDRCQ